MVLQGAFFYILPIFGCFILAYITYNRRDVGLDFQEGLSHAPMRLLLLLAVLAILVGGLMFSIRVYEVSDDPNRWSRPYSSKGVSLIVLGALAGIIGLATRIRKHS